MLEEQKKRLQNLIDKCEVDYYHLNEYGTVTETDVKNSENELFRYVEELLYEAMNGYEDGMYES